MTVSPRPFNPALFKQSSQSPPRDFVKPCSPVFSGESKYEYNVHTLCEALKVSTGTYYNHLLRNKNENTQANQKQSKMKPIIEQIFHEYNQIFGSSKIHAILKDRGYAIAESTVAKIMHANGLFSISVFPSIL